MIFSNTFCFIKAWLWSVSCSLLHHLHPMWSSVIFAWWRNGACWQSFNRKRQDSTCSSSCHGHKEKWPCWFSTSLIVRHIFSFAILSIWYPFFERQKDMYSWMTATSQALYDLFEMLTFDHFVPWAGRCGHNGGLCPWPGRSKGHCFSNQSGQ